MSGRKRVSDGDADSESSSSGSDSGSEDSSSNSSSSSSSSNNSEVDTTGAASSHHSDADASDDDTPAKPAVARRRLTAPRHATTLLHLAHQGIDGCSKLQLRHVRPSQIRKALKKARRMSAAKRSQRKQKAKRLALLDRKMEDLRIVLRAKDIRKALRTGVRHGVQRTTKRLRQARTRLERTMAKLGSDQGSDAAASPLQGGAIKWAKQVTNFEADLTVFKAVNVGAMAHIVLMDTCATVLGVSMVEALGQQWEALQQQWHRDVERVTRRGGDRNKAGKAGNDDGDDDNEEEEDVDEDSDSHEEDDEADEQDSSDDVADLAPQHPSQWVMCPDAAALVARASKGTDVTTLERRRSMIVKDLQALDRVQLEASALLAQVKVEHEEHEREQRGAGDGEGADSMEEGVDGVAVLDDDDMLPETSAVRIGGDASGLDSVFVGSLAAPVPKKDRQRKRLKGIAAAVAGGRKKRDREAQSMSDVDMLLAPPVVSKRRNRPGQRARQMAAAAAYGDKAHHLTGEKRNALLGRKKKKEAEAAAAKAKKAAVDPATMHPSWKARQEKKAQQAKAKPQGTRITFA